MRSILEFFGGFIALVGVVAMVLLALILPGVLFGGLLLK